MNANYYTQKDKIMRTNDTSKIKAKEVINQISDSLKELNTKPHALDLTIDVDADCNVSASPTGISIRVILPCTI